MESERVFLRIPVKYPLAVMVKGKPETSESTVTTDISTTGLCFESKNELAKEADLSLEIKLKKIVNPVELSAVVKWQKPQRAIGKGRFLTGVEFINPSHLSSRIISQIILRKIDIFFTRFSILIFGTILLALSTYKFLIVSVLKYFSLTKFGERELFVLFRNYPVLYPYCLAMFFLGILVFFCSIGIFYKKPLARDLVLAGCICWIILVLLKVYLVKFPLGYDYIFAVINALIVLMLSTKTARLGFMAITKAYLT